MKTITVRLVESDADEVRSSIRSTFKDEDEFKGEYLSTGCSLLNLALTDRVNCGYMEGKYYWLVGDSASGKTFLAMTCFAEAQLNKRFKNHRLIFDNVEDGALMDMERFFGKSVQKKIEPPRKVKGEDKFSETIEDFFYHVDDALEDGRPFIYVLDSMDSLTSKDEQKKFQEHKKASRRENQGAKDPAGSYGDGKAKKNSAGIRQIHNRLSKTNSILIIISQTRDNIDAGPFAETRTQSGGKALRFYATCQILTVVGAALKKKVNDRERKIGHIVPIQTKKNRITGKLRTVQTAIYPTYGIDDIGSSIDFLVFEKHWKKGGSGEIKAPELGVTTKRSKLIRLCEDGKKPRLLRALQACWDQIEAESSLDRPARYA